MGVTVNINKTVSNRFIAAPLGGALADKMGSSINYLKDRALFGHHSYRYISADTLNCKESRCIGIMLILAAIMMTIHGTYYATLMR